MLKSLLFLSSIYAAAGDAHGGAKKAWMFAGVDGVNKSLAGGGNGLSVMTASGKLTYDFPVRPEVTFENKGFDGSDLVTCNKTWKCASLPAGPQVSGTDYKSTFGVDRVPTNLKYEGADASKKYTLMMYDFGSGDSPTNMVNWACVNVVPGTAGALSPTDCYALIGPKGLTYEKKDLAGVWNAAPAMHTNIQTDGVYSMMIFEQLTDFPAVNVSTGYEIVEGGMDLWTLMTGGSPPDAIAKGGFYNYNFKSFVERYNMTYRAMNWFTVTGSVWAGKQLADTGLLPFVPPCKAQASEHCTLVDTTATPAPTPAPTSAPAPASPSPSPATTTAMPETSGAAVAGRVGVFMFLAALFMRQ